MGRIRPFAEADIPQVAALHRTAFRPRASALADELDAYRRYFTDVFLENPSVDARLPSLVYEKRDGQILGFLGVMPRRMWMNGRRLQVAISSQFVVDPGARIVAVGLAKAFFDGPQDLSISDEANDAGRRIWEALGGTVSPLHSIYWMRPLRPAGLTLSLMGSQRLAAVPRLAGQASAWLLDQLATRVRGSRLYQACPPTFEEDLREDIFLTLVPDFAGRSTLRMEYDERTFSWLLERARHRKAGHFVAAAVRKDAAIIGWYFYHLDPAGTADVLQLVARPAFANQVLDHLFYGAWKRGAVAVTGRMVPRFLRALADKDCLFHRRGPWVLLKARERELLQPLDSGDAFFSRFDGEWCLGY